MARELQAETQSTGDQSASRQPPSAVVPLTARLPRDVIAEILQFHPDEGVRWQVGREERNCFSFQLPATVAPLTLC